MRGLLLLACLLSLTGANRNYEGDLRLVGGAGPFEGRVEFYHAGEWGSVCDDGWDLLDAGVVCRQLGYPSAALAVQNGNYGQGLGSIWLDDVSCNGSEGRLSECPFSELGQHNCGHWEDAGVVCSDDFMLRIVNRDQIIKAGENVSEGRLEVYHGGRWGTVCDDQWTQQDAQVACRQLGFSGAFRATSFAQFGEGTGTIWMDQVSCVGEESDLSQCPFAGWGNEDCAHYEDAGVVCIYPNITLPLILPIRLQDGGQSAGRVEVLYNGTWGSVCDDLFSLKAAQIACQQLGYLGAVSYKPYAYYGQGTGPIWLDNVRCRGIEAGLSQCLHNPIGTHNCHHYEDVGVECSNDQSALMPRLEVRLGGSNNSWEGRVEVRYNDTWGTVCDDSWDIQDANVACRELGYRAAYRATTRANFGPGTGPIWLDDVACTGREGTLGNCSYLGLGLHNCYHSEDAGVVCERAEIELPARLVGGAGGHEGRVEVLYNGTWGTVCDDGWGYFAAEVVCRQLGFSRALSAPRNAGFGVGTADQKIWLDDVTCTGTEPDLSRCRHSPFGRHNCLHSEDASAVCSQEGIPAVRLRGSPNEWEGTVEVSYGATWGSVCGAGWTRAEADVVCYQLGYPGASRLAGHLEFGGGTGDVVLENVICQGYESYLTECDHDPMGRILDPACTHSLDAGVVCRHSTVQFPVRLIGGNSSLSGRVEIYYSGRWGSVCDDYWSQLDARVVCRMLGLNADGAVAVSRAAFGSTVGPIWLDDVRCDGFEAELSDCIRSDFSQHNCQHSEDAGVVCLPLSASPILVDQVQLSDSGVPFEGRVEVRLNNETLWGTICGYGFTYADAKVVCRQLGYPAVTQFSRSSVFSSSSNPTILSLGCHGYEEQISECNIQRASTVSCSDPSQAGVTCAEFAASRYPVRLHGGSSREGVVEVFYQGQWGTVCDNLWSTPDADVLCRQLGFPSSARDVSSTQPHYLDSSVPVWLSGLACVGTERVITDCPSDGWGATACSHTLDAGATCEPPRHPIRLTGGDTPSQGTVEVYVNGTWGVVCDDSWGLADGLVACRELGYPSVDATFSQNHFRHDTGSQTPILMDDVACAGDEMLLSACRFPGFGKHNCVLNEAAGVNCSSVPKEEETIKARLVGGRNEYEGRLEVYYEGTWGTVCDDFWQSRNAEVVCRQLGFEGPAAVLTSVYPVGTGAIWLDDVICTGTEAQLGGCFHRSWGRHNCHHFEDVDIQCYYGVPKPAQETYEVRIVDGPSAHMGVVEILYHGRWGGICGARWSQFEGEVVCRQLGYLRALETLDSDVFGVSEAENLIWLNSVSCSGTETTLNECTHSQWGVTACSSYWDTFPYYFYSNNLAAVVCTNDPINMDPVMLSGGLDHSQGRVEINYEAKWGTICGSGWTMKDANVLCRSLGYPNALSADTNSEYGSGNHSIALDNVNCLGNETFIQNCAHSPWGYISPSCVPGEVAGVRCNGTPSALRLRGGSDASSGVIEVRHEGVWGTICSGGFGYYDAKVICGDLGYPGVVSWGSTPHTLSNNHSAPVWLNYLGCSGTEASLNQCYKSSWGVPRCYSRAVAVANCSLSPAGEGQFRVALVDGATDTSGRVEVNLHNIWGTICSLSSYGEERIAKVVCYQLGLPSESPIAYRRAASDTTGSQLPIHFSYMRCTGEESSLSQCYNNTELSSYRACTHRDDLYVECDTSGHCSALLVAPPLRASDQGSVPYGGLVTFSCESGTLVGVKQLICTRGGDWYPVGPLPVCLPDCPLGDLALSNLTLLDGGPVGTDVVRAGTSVTLSCMPGAAFDTGTQFTVSCGSDGKWHNAPTSQCVKISGGETAGLSSGGIVAISLVFGILFLVGIGTVVVVVLLLAYRGVRGGQGRANFFYRSLASKEVSESMEELADARLVPLSEPDIPDDDPIIPIN